MNEFAPDLLREASIPTARYTVIKPIGQREHSLAVVAADWETGEDVFIKTKIADHLGAGEKLAKEAELLAEVGGHPQIPNLVDANVDEGTRHPYIVTEFKPASQEPVAFLKEHGASRWAARFCLAATVPMAYMHENGIAHRDIKTENFLWQWPDRAWLTDFELGIRADDRHDPATKFFEDDVASPDEVTTENLSEEPFKAQRVFITCTAKYVAPERALGHRGDGRSDVYSFGIVMHELFLGKVPFNGGESDINVARMHVTEPIDLSNTNGRNVPPQILEVIETATQKQPGDRYASAAEMGAAIKPYVWDTAHRHERTELRLAA